MLLKNTLASAVVKAVPDGAPTKDWLEAAAIGMASAYVIQVTPRMAETWLKQNTLEGKGNRKFRKAHARTIAEEMRRGEWKLTHQGIAFGMSGRLLDGQHRLSAIVESGTTQSILVFIDAPEDTFDNHDRGAMRGIADILAKDAKLTSLGTTLVRLCTRGAFNMQRKPIPSEVAKVIDVFTPDIQAMKDASATERPGRTLAAIKAAWLIQHHGASEPDKKLLCQQWKAFAEYDPKRMDETTASGDKRLEHYRAQRGGSMEIESACIGWLMFDPARRDLSRVIIKNTSTAMDELRAAARVILPELVPLEAASKKLVADKSTHGNTGVARGWADPAMGPVYRARAQAVIAAKRGQAQAA